MSGVARPHSISTRTHTFLRRIQLPIYDLLCNECGGEIVDVLIKSYKSPLPKCDCGGETRKLISTPAFRFAQPGGTDRGRLMQIAKKRT